MNPNISGLLHYGYAYRRGMEIINLKIFLSLPLLSGRSIALAVPNPAVLDLMQGTPFSFAQYLYAPITRFCSYSHVTSSKIDWAITINPIPDKSHLRLFLFGVPDAGNVSVNSASVEDICHINS